jgi:hypothetical protein
MSGIGGNRLCEGKIGTVGKAETRAGVRLVTAQLLD